VYCVPLAAIAVRRPARAGHQPRRTATVGRAPLRRLTAVGSSLG
jgi:hypothetical protein